MLGAAVPWTEPNGSTSTIKLETAKQRRLFAYLLASKTRDVKGLPQQFVDGIKAAHTGKNDPAAASVQQTPNPSASGPWKIKALKIEGFGGVNIWNGKPFELAIDGESLLLTGPNGSGKSSLTAAIIWALTGERPRDQGDGAIDKASPVFNEHDRTIGSWPALAAYPPEASALSVPPNVRVEITFENAHGATASAVRRFDGKTTTFTLDPTLEIPPILLEAGLLMPSRMPHLRLDEGRGRLTDAIQKLTGLDELIELGSFVQGLCHASRDFLSYKRAEVASARTEFDKQIERARTVLAPAGIEIPSFKPSDTDHKDGEMAKLGKTLNDKAAELVTTISGDLAESLSLGDPKVQQRIVVALSRAEEDLKVGLKGLSSFKLIDSIAAALPQSERKALRDTVITAETTLKTALEDHEKQTADSKFRLKAAGALWHSEHSVGTIDNCPLCTASLSTNPSLKEELEALRSAGESATRTLIDNLNAIGTTVRNAVPTVLRKHLGDSGLPNRPRERIARDFASRFIEPTDYKTLLVKFAILAGAATSSMPVGELPEKKPRTPPVPATADVSELLDEADLLCELADWRDANVKYWFDWWNKQAVVEDSADETLASHIRRLSKAIGEADPYRLGADAMRIAWVEGKAASAIIKEQESRQEIAKELEPLKRLGNLAEAQARSAINELSGRISAIHSATYLADRLKFQNTSLDKKTGLVVRGQLAADMRIDATLIANTSWLRGILWAFIHALREEAVEQIGGDIFPVIMLDDPQQTFDSEHRSRWAEQIAKLQKTAPGAQVLLTTHDEPFISLLGVLGVNGRHAYICSAGEEFGHIAILEGDELDRKWAAANKAKTPANAKAYIAAVREYTEGVLKLMLRGMDPDVPTFVMGESRNKISELNQAQIEPWNRPAFKKLVGDLAKGRKEIKWMEESHHSGTVFSMNEAGDVEKHWRQDLRPALERGFQIIRDHRALHGGLTALHAFPPSVSLPEGHKEKVREYKLPLLGAASAITDGRAADGCVDMTFASSALLPVELKDHLVFRLLTPTLEPVARAGHLLLVRDHAEVSPLSLVVALHENRLLARRLQVADNHHDVAVLTASAINPRMTAAPIVAKLSTLVMKKIVGVLYDAGSVAGLSEMEIDGCGTAAIATILSASMGYVEVKGYSAEPLALDKQFLLIGNSLSLKEAEQQLDGAPVIAETSDGDNFFKRLRVEADYIILESLEIGGNFAPILLSKTPGTGRHVTKLWPVTGALFEKP